MDTVISVIMPVKNNEKYLPNAIESILNQTYSNWELIIVDGMSTDGTWKIAKDYCDNDDRIKLICKDEWIYESINIGINEASGQYVTVLNSDDYLEPNALKTAAKYISKYDIDVFLFAVDVALVDKECKVIHSNKKVIINQAPDEFVLADNIRVKNNWVNLIQSGLLNNQLNVYRKDLIKDIRFRNDIYGADYLFNLTVLPYIKSVAYYPKCLYQFREYCGVEGMNASIEKYYDYSHMMFNEFYYKAIEVFSNAGMLSDIAIHAIRKRRIDDFIFQLSSYSYDSCNLSLENKLRDIFFIANDVYGIFASEKMSDDLENLILDTVISLIKNSDDYGCMEIIVDGVVELQKDKADIEKIEKMVNDYHNPSHIGNIALQKYCQEEIS